MQELLSRKFLISVSCVVGFFGLWVVGFYFFSMEGKIWIHMDFTKAHIRD